MSNEHYDEFCKATYTDLTPLERQLLGHYCTRFNETVIPPRAWPGLQELINITNAHPKSISRALGKLVKLDYLYRVTLASKERGKKAEYAPNRNRIRSQIKVTEELPNIQDVTHLQVTSDGSIGNFSTLRGNLPVASKPLDGYPKPNEPMKPNNVERFQLVILNSLPERLRTISPGANYEKLLDECDSLGITDEIRRLIVTNRWHNVEANAGGIVSKIIKEAIERKRSGQLVASPIKATSHPERYVEETRELEPISDKTKELIEETKRKMINTFGAMPE